MATLTVTNTNDAGAGSLRQAVIDAVGGDDITFNGALSGGTITLATGEMAIAKNLTIDGDLNDDNVPDITVSGGGASRIFNVSGGNSITLDGLTMTNGNDTQGGAIEMSTGSTLNITDSVFSNNVATNNRGGGAIYSTNAAATTLSVANSTFTNNTATGAAGADGGHITSRSAGGSLTLTDSAFSSGQSLDIGGAVLTAGLNTVTVTNSSFTGSSAAAGGGAFLNGTTISVTGSTFSGNSATFGGGGLVISATGTGTVTNTTLSGNSANAYGGGLRVSGTTNVYSSTITNNRADANDTDGAGHIGGGLQVAGGTTSLFNTVVSGNFNGTAAPTEDDVANTSTIAAATNSFFGGMATVTTATASPTAATAGDDAQLSALANNGGSVQTHTLASAASPLVNAGDNGSIPGGVTTDAAGNARIQNTTVDIGAFESAFSLAPPVTGSVTSVFGMSVLILILGVTAALRLRRSKHAFSLVRQ